MSFALRELRTQRLCCFLLYVSHRGCTERIICCSILSFISPYFGVSLFVLITCISNTNICCSDFLLARTAKVNLLIIVDLVLSERLQEPHGSQLETSSVLCGCLKKTWSSGKKGKVLHFFSLEALFPSGMVRKGHISKGNFFKSS